MRSGCRCGNNTLFLIDWKNQNVQHEHPDRITVESLQSEKTHKVSIHCTWFRNVVRKDTHEYNQKAFAFAVFDTCGTMAVLAIRCFISVCWKSGSKCLHSSNKRRYSFRSLSFGVLVTFSTQTLCLQLLNVCGGLATKLDPPVNLSITVCRLLVDRQAASCNVLRLPCFVNGLASARKSFCLPSTWTRQAPLGVAPCNLEVPLGKPWREESRRATQHSGQKSHTCGNRWRAI